MWKFGNLYTNKEGYYTDFFGNEIRMGSVDIEKKLWEVYVRGKRTIIKFKDGSSRMGYIDCVWTRSLAHAETFQGGLYWFKDNQERFYGSEVEEVCVD